ENPSAGRTASCRCSWSGPPVRSPGGAKARLNRHQQRSARKPYPSVASNQTHFSEPDSNDFTYQNAGTPQGTFAFSDPGTTVGSKLAGVTVGDSIALPAFFVSSVTYGTNSIKVVTNFGTTTFSNVTFGSTKPTGYTLSTDPSRLERITFTTQQTTSFQQSNSSGPLGSYPWSVPA